MNKLLVYVKSSNQRVNYILKTIFVDFYGVELSIIHDENEFLLSSLCKMSYDRQGFANVPNVHYSGLICENHSEEFPKLNVPYENNFLKITLSLMCLHCAFYIYHVSKSMIAQILTHIAGL
jgi:hypothetical protein